MKTCNCFFCIYLNWIHAVTAMNIPNSKYVPKSITHLNRPQPLFLYVFYCENVQNISVFRVVGLTIQNSFKKNNNPTTTTKKTCSGTEIFNFVCLKLLTFDQIQMAQGSRSCKIHFYLKCILAVEMCWICWILNHLLSAEYGRDLKNVC